VDFFEKNLQVMAFGSGKLTGSDGQIYDLPQYMRGEIRSLLYKDYKKDCEALAIQFISEKEFVTTIFFFLFGARFCIFDRTNPSLTMSRRILRYVFLLAKAMKGGSNSLFSH
jgi:hypothetical protein